jgi:predicted dehydrogenase
MARLKIGVIGAGGIARGVHLPALRAIPEADLRAVCDLRADRAKEAALQFGIPKTYLSYHDLLREGGIDAVYVLVPPDGLFRVAADALLAGKHVFMEKPMGISVFQARTLKETAAAQGRVLHVGFNRRFIPLVQAVAAKMREFCPLSHVEGRFYKNSSPAFYGGCAGAFICDVIHVIDLVRHLAAGDSGPSPRAIRASTLESSNPDTGIGEAWYSTLAFDRGPSALIRANYRSGGRVHQFELHGPGASAYIDLGFGGPSCGGKILRTLVPGGQSLSSAGAGEQEILEFDGLALAGSEKYEVYYGYYAEDRCFVETVLANPAGTDPARAEEDCASMELAEQLLAARL